MPFVNNNTYCAACHKSAEVKEKLKDTTRACDIFCKKCHKNMSKHHPAGVKLKNDLPENITLSSGKKLACITCHDLKVPRYDSVSWKAESLFGSIFKSEKRYKTYYLIIRNNDGDLCRKCKTKVIKKEIKKRNIKDTQTYYFEYYLLCPQCKTIYMTDEAKRIIVKNENTLF